MANVVLPFDGDFQALRRTLAQWGWDVGERPNAPVFATGPGVTLHAYATGKLLLNGPRAEEYAGALREAVRAPPAAKPREVPRAETGWVVHFDGACLPKNPGGVAAYGYQVARDGAVVHEGHGLAAPPGPGATNNVAEFTGLVEALRWLKAKGAQKPVIRGDSQLVVNTVNGHWNVHAPHIKPLHAEAVRLLAELGARLEWVPRAQNAEADRLSELGAAEAIRAHPEWGYRSPSR